MKKVLFVCMGNICRSPTAKVVFAETVKRHRVADRFEIDSAGTENYHIGEMADPRTRQAARTHGYDLSAHHARQLVRSDFSYFDHIVVMDEINLDTVRRRFRDEDLTKVSLFLSWIEGGEDVEVPDPYYGGSEGFREVISLCEKASEAMLEKLLKTAS